MTPAAPVTGHTGVAVLGQPDDFARGGPVVPLPKPAARVLAPPATA
jgi:hypothetical protein